MSTDVPIAGKTIVGNASGAALNSRLLINGKSAAALTVRSLITTKWKGIETMHKYYQVKTTNTGADLFSNQYETFDRTTEYYKTKAEALAAVKETYVGKKRNKMFVDKTDGSTEHTGYVYRFRNADMSHAPVREWNQQDWVEISEVTEKVVIN